MGLRSTDFLSCSRSAGLWRSICFFLLVLGLLLAALITFAVVRTPDWIEKRLRASLTEKGFHEVELNVTRAVWKEIDIAGLCLAKPGWNARAEVAHLQFRPLGFLDDDYEILELTGLKVEVDVEELLQRQDFQLPTSLKDLHLANRYDLVRLHEARLQIRRAGAVEQLVISGDFRTQGPVALTISGQGISTFTLSLDGTLEGARGDASLKTGLKSDRLAPLLDALTPGWLQKNPIYSVDGVELNASFQLVEDRPFVTDAGGIIHWRGWQFDNGQISPAVVHARKQGDAVVLQSETLALQRNDGLSARGHIEATFAPEGAAADTPFLQGLLHVESWSSPEVTLEPMEVPFAGTPANLRLGPVALAVPGKQPHRLRDLWVRLENPPEAPLRAQGKALLDISLPAVASLAGMPPLLSLPATGRLHGPQENRTLDFTVHAENARGAPLQFGAGGYLVQLTAVLTGSVPPGPPPREIALQLDLPQLDWRSQGRPLLRLSGLTLAGSSRGGLLKAEGKGLWEGESFPLAIRQSAPGASSPASQTVTTALSLGPIPLRNATWPGNLVKAWRGTRSFGELHLSGTLTHPPAGRPGSLPRPDLSIRLREGQLIYPDEVTTARGVQADARLISLVPVQFAPGISLTVEQISAGKVELNQVRLSASLTPPDRVRIDSFEAGLLGGTIRIAEPVDISADSPDFTVLFELSGIQGSQVVQLFPKFKGSVQASISGRVPLAVEGQEIRFLEGHLHLDESKPAHLSYDASGFLTSGKAGRKPKFAQSVERALGNLTIQTLDIRVFDPSDPTHPAILKLAGIGVDDKLNLPVNLTIPVEDEEGILQSLFSRVLSAGMNVLSP